MRSTTMMGLSVFGAACLGLVANAGAGTEPAINAACPVTGEAIESTEGSLSVAFAGVTIGLASEDAATTWVEEWSSEQRAAYIAGELAHRPVNTMCPMSGAPADSKITSSFDATTVAFCGDMHCLPAWEKMTDDEKRAMLLKIVAAEPLNRTCPAAMDYEVESEIDLAFNGLRIAFGSEKCRTEFNEKKMDERLEYVTTQLMLREEEGRPLMLAAAKADAPASEFTRNVAIVIYPGVEVLDFTGPGEVFQAAGVLGKRGDDLAFKTYTVALSKEPLVSQRFLTVVPEYTFKDCPTPDIIMIPGGPAQSLADSSEFMDWVKELAANDTLMMSVCTGAFIYAEAGLLDGLDVTTFYGAIPALRKQTPKANVLEGRRFIDNGNVVTTAGVSAGIDGSLHVVARLVGLAVAAKTARYMEYRWMPEAAQLSEYQMIVEDEKPEPDRLTSF